MNREFYIRFKYLGLKTNNSIPIELFNGGNILHVKDVHMRANMTLGILRINKEHFTRVYLSIKQYYARSK